MYLTSLRFTLQMIPPWWNPLWLSLLCYSLYYSLCLWNWSKKWWNSWDWKASPVSATSSSVPHLHLTSSFRIKLPVSISSHSWMALHMDRALTDCHFQNILAKQDFFRDQNWEEKHGTFWSIFYNQFTGINTVSDLLLQFIPLFSLLQYRYLIGRDHH